MIFLILGFRPEDKGMVSEELKLADAVVLTYDCDRPETLESLTLRWLPELRLLEVLFSFLSLSLHSSRCLASLLVLLWPY